MARTAFVTGGTGFLGRHVVEQLTSLGWRVVALHRPTSDVRHLKAYGVELAVGSITEPDSLRAAIPEGCDAVFHIAGNTSLWSGDREQQTRENVDGTRFVVEAALAKKARRLVHTSTEGAWGEQQPHEAGFDETAKSNALDSFINYERSKYLGELEVEKGVAAGLEACMMCPGHIVGKYDTSQWARLITLVNTGKLPGVPPGRGTWAHATQVAKAHVAAVDRGRSGERYLLGGAWASYLEVVTVIGRLTGKKVPVKTMPGWVIRALGRVSQWGSYVTRRAPTVTPEIAAGTSRPPHLFKSDKAIRELGYEAVPVEAMLKESFDWLKAEGLV
ncbi:MAG TPA: NAD-dependent epimerase/dehydratase family protein [Polyangiaceae bacterium]|jgi:nucleoside-diphosphate-sugar epimerase